LGWRSNAPVRPKAGQRDLEVIGLDEMMRAVIGTRHFPLPHSRSLCPLRVSSSPSAPPPLFFGGSASRRGWGDGGRSHVDSCSLGFVLLSCLAARTCGSRVSVSSGRDWHVRRVSCSRVRLRWSEQGASSSRSRISDNKASFFLLLGDVAALLLLLLPCRGGRGRNKGDWCGVDLKVDWDLTPVWCAGATPRGC
jgi:hypothetical protein